MRLPSTLDQSLALRRVARRAGLHPRRAVARRAAVDQPVGIKLELTYRCNLRCGFCFTDSPRRTLEGTLDMPDERWRRVVDEAIDLGAIEAVVTGGEPLLRRDLTLELVERLSAAGLAVSLNTNGWFVDADVADRLAACRGLRAHVSIDGASPQLHDGVRGVPGSWRRAIGAVDLLLAREVPVEVLHIVNPTNAATLDQFLELMWLLGVRRVGASTVVPIGAAARDPGWAVPRHLLHRAIRNFRRRHGADMELVVEPPAVEGLATRDDRPPASMLVRPNGAVRIDSMHPFSFGSVDEGLGTCWQRIATGWQDARIAGWARGIGSAARLPDASLVPYRDEELAIAGAAVPVPTARRREAGRLAEPPTAKAVTDLEPARREVLDRSLSRPHRLGAVRAAGRTSHERYVRVLDSSTTYRVNRTVATVMDACSDGTPADAVRELHERHPSIPIEHVERDTIQAVRWLALHLVLRPRLAPRAA